MRYVTLAQLAEIPGAQELAQVASDRHGPIVDAVLMELTLTAGDRSAYPPDEIAAADQARARIEQASTEADELCDGYLGRRYVLPLAHVPGILSVWARLITRYKLHGDRISGEGTDPVVRDYRDAIKFLTQVAEGKFSLGINDPIQGPLPVDVRVEPGHKVFGREFLP